MSQSFSLLGSHASASSSSFSSDDSEVGGVLLVEHPPPPAQLSEKAEGVAAWLSCVATPSPAPKQFKKSVRYSDSKAQNRSLSPIKRSRAAPYAITSPSSSSGGKSATKLAPRSTATAVEPAAKSTPSTSPADASAAPLSHLDIITELLDNPYEGVCPFITATACPQGPKCALKVMKPSTITLCPSYLKNANKSNCRNRSSQHRKGFSHNGDDGFEELIKLKELRDVHKKGEWGI